MAGPMHHGASQLICSLDRGAYMETNFVYGHFVTELMRLLPQSTFVLMSGTLPLGLQIAGEDQQRIICHERKYALDCYQVLVENKLDEALHLARFFLEKTAHSVLVFLAGKPEIEDAKSRLLESGIAMDLLESLHGDVGAEEMRRRTQAGYPKIYLSTNVGETSLTVPGAVVISLNEQRYITYDCGVLQFSTVFPSAASQSQRNNRSGRTEDGISITLGDHGESQKAHMNSDSVMRVL